MSEEKTVFELFAAAKQAIEKSENVDTNGDYISCWMEYGGPLPVQGNSHCGIHLSWFSQSQAAQLRDLAAKRIDNLSKLKVFNFGKEPK
jgi:hypothetical protein